MKHTARILQSLLSNRFLLFDRFGIGAECGGCQPGTGKLLSIEENRTSITAIPKGFVK